MLKKSNNIDSHTQLASPEQVLFMNSHPKNSYVEEHLVDQYGESI